jgi:hypothetical protein
MKRILFPTDFSEAATNAFGTISIWKKIQGELILLHSYVLPIDEQFSQRILRWSMTRLS